MKSVLMASDYKYPGGYFTIANGLARTLAEHGVDVTVIGRSWDQSEHTQPFRVVPSDTTYLPLHIYSLAKELKPDWVIIMMDVPRIVSIFDNIVTTREMDFANRFKCAAIFPVESEPMSYPKWVAGLSRFAMRFTFTQFGVEQCRDSNIGVHRLNVGLDQKWYGPPANNPAFKFDFPYVLMVAENQIRKNQDGAFRMVKEAGKNIVLITEPLNPDGWDLFHLAEQCGLEPKQRLIINKASVNESELLQLYQGAESLILTSVAEGIGLPLYEAQAQGCPVIATNCCGIPEAVVDKTKLINVSNVTPYPWGNTFHHWPDIAHGATLLKEAEGHRIQAVKFPPWSMAGEQLFRYLSLFEDISEAVK